MESKRYPEIGFVLAFVTGVAGRLNYKFRNCFLWWIFVESKLCEM